MIYFSITLLFFCSWWLPWWGACLIGGIIGYVSHSWKQALGVSFLSCFIFWIGLCYYFDLRSHGLIGKRMAQLFSLPNPLYLYFLIGILGGILCLCGAQLGYRIKLRRG